MTDTRCTCGAGGGPLHSITCLVTADTQPHAMVDDKNQVFYPDNDEDARHFADGFGAWPLNPDRWPLGPVTT